MLESNTPVTLKSGETVQLAIIKTPDSHWTPAISHLLGHKGLPWTWQIEQMLTQPHGLDFYHYILHRDGHAFSHICSAELHGVGSFGHVYTDPPDRRKGAATTIMRSQMPHFRDRGGRCLTLETRLDGPAYKIYETFGFVGVEPNNGHMTYTTQPLPDFLAEHFAPCTPVIEPIAWKHFPSAAVLFLADLPGVVRMSPHRIFGRVSSDLPVLQLLHDRLGRPDPRTRAHALVNPTTSAVLALAVWDFDPLWPDTVIVDIFSHPTFWPQAPNLLSALELPKNHQHLAYSDSQTPQKQDALEQVGFKPLGTLPTWIPQNNTTARLPLTVLHRSI